MECKMCGKILSEQERFCTYCGHYYDPNEIDEDLQPVELNSKTGELLNEHNKRIREEYDDKESFKTRCLKVYLKKEYENVTTGSFNLYAMIFSWIYFIYKKMYLIGIVGLMIAGILVIYQRVILIVYAIISMILSGIFFNKIYNHVVTKKVDKIISLTNNQQKVLKLIKVASADNILLTLGIYFVFLVTVILLYLNIDNVMVITDKYYQENNSNKATCISIVKAAKSISSIDSVAFILEAECVVIDQNMGKYEAYLKYDRGEQIVIEKYETRDDKIYFIENTDMLKGYKSNLNNLNDSERVQYEKMIQLEEKYYAINKSARQEDSLIKNNSNVSAKKNFVLTQEEASR